eukprot:COSAG02_NODE_4569_length_5209_cov_18.188258_3_plen_127_part_00
MSVLVTKHHLQQNLNLLTHWQVNGAHYGLTSEAWLQNMDKNEKELLPILGDICAITVPYDRTRCLVLEHAYQTLMSFFVLCTLDGKGEEVKWFARWRGFFLACAECFFYDGGNEWFVSHYLFQKPA